MKTPAFTPGPLTVKINEKWPFDMDTIDANGKCVFSTQMPCHSTLDKSFDDALNCVNFRGKLAQTEGRKLNQQALADEYLRAAAPELFEALQNLIDAHAIPSTICKERPVYEAAIAALKKATGVKK